MVDFTFTFAVGSLNTLQVKRLIFLDESGGGAVIISHLKAVRWHHYCLKHTATVMPDLRLCS